MIDTAKLDAIRYWQDSLLNISAEPGQKEVRLPNSIEPEYLSVLRFCNLAKENCMSSFENSLKVMKTEFKKLNSNTGKVVDPTTPYQLNSGILSLSKGIEDHESRLNQFIQVIDLYAEELSFNSGDLFADLAATSIARVRDLVERTIINLHGHLWVLWTLESAKQAAHMHHLIVKTERFPNHSKDFVALLAHPPIIVSTLASTAMIEEVGTEFINKYTKGSQNPDETKCLTVLNKLERYNCIPENVSTRRIRDYVVDERTNLAHYLRARADSIVTEDLGKYLDAIYNALLLVSELLEGLFFKSLDRFEDEMESLSKELEES